MAAGDTVTITYSGVSGGDYVSAILLDGTTVKYHASKVTGASGTWELTLPTGLEQGKTYTLKLFSEYQNGDNQTDYASAPVTLSLRVTLPSFAVSATASPAAGGTVTSAGDYESGSTAQLTATPNAGYAFVNWTKDGTPVSTDATYSFTVTEATALVANFQLVTYTVTVTDDGNGTATADPASGNMGQEVKLTATPKPGYQFKEWQVAAGGVTITNDKFNIGTANVEVKAVFELVTYTVTVTDDGNGTASADPASGNMGQEVTLTTTPKPGYQFKEWQVVSGGVTVTDDKFTIGTADVEIKAIFELVTYTVTVTDDGNGTASADPTSGNISQEVTLTASPKPGYQFKEWQVVAGDVTITDNKFTIGTADVEIKAVFELVTYTVTVTNDGNGTASANPTSGNMGQEVALTASPKPGYQFKEWQVVSGGVMITNNKFTIGTADVEIKAVFEAITYTVTVTDDGNGTASADPTSGNMGQEVILTASPNPGYRFKEWQVAAGGVTITDNKFTIGTANVELKAVFELVTYTVTITDDGNGTASADPTSGNMGQEVKLTATPSAGYQFKEWQVAAGGVTVVDNKFTIGTADVEIKAVFEAITYTLTEGANSSWRKDSGKSLVLKVVRTPDNDACFGHFAGVEIDGKAVTDFTAVSGSTVITLKPSALNGLKTGKHTITVLFDDGKVETTVTIQAAYDSTVGTGDERQPNLWLGLMAFSVMGLAGLLVLERRRQRHGR